MGDHLSRPAVAGRLERCTRFLGGPRHRNLLHLAPDGVWLAAVSPRRWWALTPPFHPYCRRLRRVCRRKRSPFCATFRRLSPPGVSPASCPSVSGLSSDRCLFPARGHPACTLIVAGARGKTRAPARSRFTRQGVGAAARAGDPPRVAPSGATRARPPLRAGRRPASAVSRPERGAGASRLLSFVVVCAAPRPRCAAAGTSRAALPRRVGQQRAGEAGLSMPLACASSLDRCRPSCVEALWSPESSLRSINGRQKQRRIAQLELTHVESAGSFSLSGGASSVLMSCSSRASPLG